MARYASDTNVSVERSQEQVKQVLRRYGANRFGVMEEERAAAVIFEIRGITVRIVVPLPGPNDDAFRLTDTGKERSESAAWKAYEQAVKSRWRALLLAIKAKLEAVESGISTIETEFMPFMVMPDGQTVGQHLLPRIEEAVKQGRMPSMLALPAPQKGGE